MRQADAVTSSLQPGHAVQAQQEARRPAVAWGVAVVFAAFHVVALAALTPGLFSWSGVVIMIAGAYVFGGCGINICCHRLLTHRSFTTPTWFERVLTCLAFCNLQGSSLQWVAMHRMHHQHSDTPRDPHSPAEMGFWGAHMLWMLREFPKDHHDSFIARYARDLRDDPFHRLTHRFNTWLLVWLAHAVLVVVAGFVFGAITATPGSNVLRHGAQMALSWAVWGVALRTVFVWHVTWSINSVTHLWGYRNHQTRDDSRNNWLLGLLALGEGWHNNHHAHPRAARHGHAWWEVDMSYLTIRLFGLVGLARDIVEPPPVRRVKGSQGQQDVQDGPTDPRQCFSVPPVDER